MALDFYELDKKSRGNRLFELNEKDFELISPFLFDLKRLTGMSIDFYGTTRIYNSHVRLLASLIKTHLDESNLAKTKEEKVKKEHLIQILSLFDNIEGD